MEVATQRLSANMISGAIKANFPARVTFRVSSIIDSRTILDAPVANQLLGQGDMLFKHGNKLVLIQSAFIDMPEIENLVKFISEQTAIDDTFILPKITDKQKLSEIEKSYLDPLFEEASEWAKPKKTGFNRSDSEKVCCGSNSCKHNFRATQSYMKCEINKQ